MLEEGVGDLVFSWGGGTDGSEGSSDDFGSDWLVERACGRPSVRLGERVKLVVVVEDRSVDVELMLLVECRILGMAEDGLKIVGGQLGLVRRGVSLAAVVVECRDLAGRVEAGFFEDIEGPVEVLGVSAVVEGGAEGLPAYLLLLEDEPALLPLVEVGEGAEMGTIQGVGGAGKSNVAVSLVFVEVDFGGEFPVFSGAGGDNCGDGGSCGRINLGNNDVVEVD